ncbi:MAG: hypothetical protein ACI9WV_000855 [Patiriisocius sp.]|jgi:hypothetical protein
MSCPVRDYLEYDIVAEHAHVILKERPLFYWEV